MRIRNGKEQAPGWSRKHSKDTWFQRDLDSEDSWEDTGESYHYLEKSKDDGCLPKMCGFLLLAFVIIGMLMQLGVI